MKRVVMIFSVIVALAVSTAFVSYNDDNQKTVNKKLVGKWEVQSITVNGIENFTNGELTTPEGDKVVSQGYEFTSNTCKVFTNGSVVENVSGVHTEGDALCIPAIEGEVNFNWQLSGKTLTLTMTTTFEGGVGKITLTSDYVLVYTCKKVSKFTWK